MKYLLPVVVLSLASCSLKDEKTNHSKAGLEGTWRLLSAATIENGKTRVIDFSGDLKMLKIINGTHFAFLKHSLNPKDSTNFDAGGGRYTFAGDDYTEYLDFYKDKNWEGKTFKFKVTFSGDTLIQKGVEKVEKANVDRIIIEKYIKEKP
ncbi:hypothetical protein GJU39_08275 [Pedobacter petrophilus]|uniref:Lipocalin-like domain-containing protein n=1 Tax=Pedobacter petrophilus TaxID=1908241 RepID=A0A7K0FYD4_9SPHI|nr:hypothetical protein [Pedobacter petrophilus]